jgi:hypothetical protein
MEGARHAVGRVGRGRGELQPAHHAGAVDVDAAGQARVPVGQGEGEAGAGPAVTRDRPDLTHVTRGSRQLQRLLRAEQCPLAELRQRARHHERCVLTSMRRR